jgi:ribosomal protein S18 acetylase RimI-like enzyme
MDWHEDQWLAGLLGKKCLTLGTGNGSAGLSGLGGHAPALYTAKVATSNLALANQLERDQFLLVDTTVTLQLSTYAGGVSKARFAVPEDEPAVRRIAAESFTLSRFHADKEIEADTANRIKEEWAANYFCGKRGDCMLVIEDNGKVAGFLLAIKSNNGAIIDLIAVQTGHRQKGYGKQLVDKLWVQFAGPGAFIRVGTQITNIRSLVFYQKMGFRQEASHYVFHKHV